MTAIGKHPKFSGPHSVLSECFDTHKPEHVCVLFSGGHDSMVTTYVAAKWAEERSIPFSVLHINTGIGIEQTRTYVRDQCDDYGWNLYESKATENRNAKGESDPQIYEELVMRYGFPGPHGHGMMYARLKERPLRMARRELAPQGRLMLVSGCRSEESTRRMGTTTPISVQGQYVWSNPIHDWTKLHCNGCMRACGIRRNRVVDLIHKSGECLCGAFVKPGEFDELALHFPDVAERIRELEREVWDIWPWGWEDERPPKWFVDKRRGQSMLFEMEPDKPGPMCHSCQGDE